MTIKPCPCGKTPTELFISGQHDQDKWPTVTGCCGEWEVSFKNPHHLDINGEEVAALGAEAWNSAPRQDDAVTTSPRIDIDHELMRRKVWTDVWAATTNTMNCANISVIERYADAALKAFDERFQPIQEDSEK